MKVLLVRNASTGGVAKNVDEIARGLVTSGVGVSVLEPAPGGFRYAKDYPSSRESWLTRSETDDPGMVELIRSAGIGHCHIHSQLGFGQRTWLQLVDALSELEISYDVTLHDYSFSCPRVNLVDFTRKYCGEPEVDQCEVCISINPPPLIKVSSVRNHRSQNLALLMGARKIFVPTHDVAKRADRQLGGDLTYLVRPHLEVPDLGYRQVSPSSELTEHKTATDGNRQQKIAVLGSLTIHKGSELVLTVAQMMERNHPDIQLHLVGRSDRDREFAELTNTTIWGTYNDDQVLASALETLEPDLVWFPALWPETYSYTLTVAMSLGLPVAYFDFGAIEERARKFRNGRSIPFELLLDPKGVLEKLVAIMKKKEQPKSSPMVSVTGMKNILEYYEYPLSCADSRDQ